MTSPATHSSPVPPRTSDKSRLLQRCVAIPCVNFGDSITDEAMAHLAKVLVVD